MSWRDWFSIESWFFTTAVAQGLRDARHDYPKVAQISAKTYGRVALAFA